MQKSVGNKRSETFPYKQKKEEIERCYRGEGERERLFLCTRISILKPYNSETLCRLNGLLLWSLALRVKHGSLLLS